VVNYCELTQEEYEELSSFPNPSGMSMDIHKAEVQGSTFRKSPSVKNSNNPNTLYVPWELFQQLPPRVQKLVSEAKKAEPGYVPCKLNSHEQVSTDDLAPDIGGLSISGNEDGMHISVANEGVHGAGTIDDQALYDHIRGDAPMEAGDIRPALAAKQKCHEDGIKQQYSAKKTMVIDGVKWYSANIHHVTYNVSKHHASRLHEMSLLVAASFYLLIKKGNVIVLKLFRKALSMTIPLKDILTKFSLCLALIKTELKKSMPMVIL